MSLPDAPPPPPTGATEVARLLTVQSGVISHRQVRGAGGHAWEVKRRLRRREWVRLLPGGYVDHTGEPTWLLDRPCRTTGRVSLLLRQRGWTGLPQRCGLECDLPDDLPGTRW